MADRQSQLAGILYSALGARIGVLVSASDRVKARQALYQARVKSGDPDLNCLQIRFSPFEEGDLVIVKGQEGQDGARAVTVERT